MQEPNSYGKVKYGQVKAALNQIAEHYQDDLERLDDVDITFEYLVGSFFPTIIKNIEAAMSQQYINGYIDGQKDANNVNDTEGS
jgi:hypothetical protein